MSDIQVLKPEVMTIQITRDLLEALQYIGEAVLEPTKDRAVYQLKTPYAVNMLKTIEQGSSRRRSDHQDHANEILKAYNRYLQLTKGHGGILAIAP